MADVIGVVSGILTIFSFVQDLFPSTDPAVNKIDFRIGLDGSQPPGGGGELSNAGGEKPDVRCFNEVGKYLAMEVNDGNKCGEGSEACSTEVETDNACAYSLFSANNDAICIGWISIKFPGGDQYGSPIGEWAEYCDANHGTGGSWYWSNVLLQTDDGGETVKCAWIDGDGDQDTTGIQIHWPEVYLLATSPRLYLARNLSFDGNGKAVQDSSYYCENNPAMRFITDDDPTSINYWTPTRRMFARDPSVGTSSADPAIEQQRRAGNEQYKRLRRQMSKDDRLVKSSKSAHSAKQLCNAGKSVGPDFVSFDEKKFCDMKTKTLYDFCDEVKAGECWDDDNNILKNKTLGMVAFAAGDSSAAKSKYGNVISWE